MKIVIVGAGPRALAIAIQLVFKGIQPTIIDPNPIHTWQAPYIIPNIEMRSPITFDLVSYIEEMQGFSLAKFLGKEDAFTISQNQIEANPIKVSRDDFCAYLTYIWRYVLSSSIHIQEPVTLIGKDYVLTPSQRVEADAIVIATGYSSTSRKTPDWVGKTLLINKLTSLSSVIEQAPAGKTIAVVGSGQGAAEVVYLLAAANNQVYWCINRPIKVHQYPAPPYSEWKSKSALGGYYRSLRDWNARMKYLGQIRQWQPSITPYIDQKLQKVKDRYVQITPTSSNQLQPIFKQADHILLLAGNTPEISSLPTDFPVPVNPYLPNFPDLVKGFRLPDSRHYFTGLLALAFDGPRQASLISAGITAQEIVQDILNDF